MKPYIEHANLTVPDIDAAIAFLKLIDPKINVYHDETPENSYRWVHIGIGDCYIALQEPHPDSGVEDHRKPYKSIGINHIGWVVDDIESVIQKLEEHGYKKGIPGDKSAYRQREYYYDSAGFEWEIIQYFSDKFEDKFRY